MGRVWLYIISKHLDENDLDMIRILGREFAEAWTAHDQKLTGSFEIFRNRIIVVKVNEDIHAASGCSIDKLTRFIKELEIKFNIELFNRKLVAVKRDDHIEVVNASEISSMLEKNEINEDTIVYETSASNTDELLRWEQMLKNTWLNKYLKKV
jgi:hypothetical protein